MVDVKLPVAGFLAVLTLWFKLLFQAHAYSLTKAKRRKVSYPLRLLRANIYSFKAQHKYRNNEYNYRRSATGAIVFV